MRKGRYDSFFLKQNPSRIVCDWNGNLLAASVECELRFTYVVKILNYVWSLKQFGSQMLPHWRITSEASNENQFLFNYANNIGNCYWCHNILWQTFFILYVCRFSLFKTSDEMKNSMLEFHRIIFINFSLFFILLWVFFYYPRRMRTDWMEKQQIILLLER